MWGWFGEGHLQPSTHHSNGIQNVTIAMAYDAHGYHQAAKKQEEHEGGVVGILGFPIHCTAQSMYIQDVSVPAQERCSCPCQGVEPDIGNGPPGPGEVDHSGMYHTDITFIGQHSEGGNGDKPCKKRKRSKVNRGTSQENDTFHQKHYTENLGPIGSLRNSKRFGGRANPAPQENQLERYLPMEKKM